LLVVVACSASLSFAMDPLCMAEMTGQRGCFWDIMKDAFGMNDDLTMETAKSTITQCFEASECKVPGRRDSSSHRVKREHHQTDFQKDFKKVKDCVEEEIGEDPFQAVKTCVQEDIGSVLPPFMLKPPKSGFAVLHNTKCPYLRLMKYIAAMNNMDDVMKGMCGGDADKVAAVQTCVQEGTGVDMMTIDRDAVKSTICENKDTCSTEKMVECREGITDMLQSACECRNSVAGEATTTCAAELNIELPALFTMTCEEIKEHNSKKFNMCHADFEWPSMQEIMGKHHGHHHHHKPAGPETPVVRRRRHEHTHDHPGHTGEASHEHSHEH
jgi:hypothetical protein